MPAELKPDDEVTDWQYQWQGPDGAESWWPAMPFVHAQIYLVTLFPAFILGVLLAWGFGTGFVSRVIPVVACLGVTWLVVSEWVKHVDAARPIGWHRAVLRSELRAPRPPRRGRRGRQVVATSVAPLLEAAAGEHSEHAEPAEPMGAEEAAEGAGSESPLEGRVVGPVAGPAGPWTGVLA